MKLISFCLTALLLLPAPLRAQTSFDPAGFDKYMGAYQVAPAMFLWVRRDGSRFFVHFTRQEEHEALPKSANVLGFADAPMEVAFSDKDVLLSNGNNERHATRVSPEFAKSAEEATAHPGQ